MQPAASRKRVAAREPFCPLGCKAPSGVTHRIGSGSCDDCYKFNSQNVQQQGQTSIRLIAMEDELSRLSSLSAIPVPTSPSREARAVVSDAHGILASMLKNPTGLSERFGG